MSAIRKLKDTLEGGPDYIKLRVLNPITEAAANQASISSISYRVIEYANEADGEADNSGTEITPAASLDKTEVIFDALQSWSIDSTGYNFMMLSPAANRPNGGKWIRHQITFTPTSGPAYTVVTLNYVIALND